jgi:cytochrome c oxidase cbb3-type subunit 4
MTSIAPYLSAVSTLIGMLVFLGIVWWAWSKHRQPANEESANLPFALEDEFEGRSHE